MALRKDGELIVHGAGHENENTKKTNKIKGFDRLKNSKKTGADSRT